MSENNNFKSNQPNLYFHKLLHGAHLAGVLFEEVGKSGDGSHPNLFEKYPELKKKFEETAEALGDFYQFVGQLAHAAQDHE